MSDPNQNPLFTALIASLTSPLSPARTEYVLMMLPITPMARTSSGKMTPLCPNEA